MQMDCTKKRSTEPVGFPQGYAEQSVYAAKESRSCKEYEG